MRFVLVCASWLMHDLRQKVRPRINIKTSEKLHIQKHTQGQGR